MNRVILRLSFVCLIFLWLASVEVEAERRRKKNRNRNNKRQRNNNDYSDDEDESLLGQFSGDSYADFMERYYGGDKKKSSILSSTYIDQEEEQSKVEGSGDFSDDEDYDNSEGSGEPLDRVNGQDLLPQWPDTSTKRNRISSYPPITTQSTKPSTTATSTTTTPVTTTSTIKSTLQVLSTTQSPVPSLTPFDTYADYVDFTDDGFDEGQSTNMNNENSATEINKSYEGSGDLPISGSGYDEECQDDDEDCERKKPSWSNSDTTSQHESLPLDTTLSTPRWITPVAPIVPIRPSLGSNDIVSTEDPDGYVIDLEEEDHADTGFKPDYRDIPDNYDDTENTKKDTATTEETEVVKSEKDNVVFGPPQGDVPTYLYSNRILVVALYSSLVFLLVSSILVVSIVVGVKHCRKKYGFVRVNGEDGSSTDSTASSDLPIIKKRNIMIQHKPSAGMMTAGLGESGVVRYDDASNRSHYAGGRRGSFSPMALPPLPDLTLSPDNYKNEKSSKFFNFFKRKEGKNEGHLNRSNNLNSSSRSSKKFEQIQNHRDWL